MRYVLIHSLNRPRFTVCPGQTWNVPPILKENLIFFQIPDWHVCPCANPVSGHRAKKCPYLKWLQVMMRVESTFTQRRTAPQENSLFPAVLSFQSGVVVAAGIVPIYPCRHHQRMPGKYIRGVVLRGEHVCAQLHGAPKIKRLLISKYTESTVITSIGHHAI